jgi:hypothetical protein
MKWLNCILLILIILNPEAVFSQDSLSFSGLLSGWMQANSGSDISFNAGVRYIPALDYQVKLKNDRILDFEASANIAGAAGFHPNDTSYSYGKIKPYRLWARYSARQWEIRIGLQKINFGSASILRPLMWFDQLDPRDPLQLTDGVWGLLYRYYFLNNANLWLWGLYGNDKPKAWEMGKTTKGIPEAGGRFQTPVPKGEIALSYHLRSADTRGLSENIPGYESVSENRIGIDGKWDVGVGLWFEGTWTGKSRYSGAITNQEIFNAGMDYTFGIGNGLNVIVEQLVFATDEKAFNFNHSAYFTGISLSYPVGMWDNISAIVFYDWTAKHAYNFVNWKHQFQNFSVYLMAFANPTDYRMPQQQEESTAMFSGKGIQIMFVYNH